MAAMEFRSRKADDYVMKHCKHFLESARGGVHIF